MSELAGAVDLTSLFDEIAGRLPASARPELVGSTLTPAQLDGWSDLDLRLILDEDVDLAGVVGAVWAVEAALSSTGQVVRTVLVDGRRVDLSVSGAGRLTSVDRPEYGFRFVAALAATKLGRGDRLIGLHLVYDLLRRCLVEAMVLRDRDRQTSIHRFGSARDVLADEVLEAARRPLEVSLRPNVIDGAVELYDRWHGELDPEYVPDWSGLSALLERGIANR